MPQVPYVPYSTERVADTATPSVRVNAPEVAFGGAVGHALEGVGKQVSHFGDELMQRAVALQQLQNETEAKEVDAQYMMHVGDLHAKYSSLQGKAAVEAYPKYMKEIQESRQTFRNNLSNDMARKMYDSSSLSTMGRTIFNGAGHAATEQKRWANGASNARVDMMFNTIFNNPSDDVNFKRLVNGIDGEVRSQGDIHGWSKEQVQDQVLRKTSSAWAHRIAGLSKTAPFEAEKMLTENRDKIHWEDLEKTENTVRQQLRTTGARVISDGVNADLYTAEQAGRPEKSLQERIREGEEKAKSTAPKDPLFVDYVRDRITSDFNKHKAAVKDFEYTNRNIVEGALMGGPNGKLPTTIEELKADPKASAAFDALDEKHQRHYLKQLAQNAKGDTAWSAEGLKRYQILKGQAHDNPTEFLDTDVVSEKMPNSAKRELINLQQRLKNNVEGDPRVNRAIGLLRPMMNAAGIERTSGGKDAYYHFVGALQDALELYQQEHKKAPNAKEIQEIGARIMQEHATPWFLNPWSKTPLYEITVPSDVSAEIKADPKWKEMGIEPTDEQIRRIYVRKRYQELYSKKPFDKRPDVPKSQ